MTDLASSLGFMLEECRFKSAPIVVHTDLFRAMPFIEIEKSKAANLQKHIDLIATYSGSNFWLPVFNYDFCSKHQVNLDFAPSQVGPLGEFYRTHQALWRTFDPVFSFVGAGSPPTKSNTPVLNPFKEGGFVQLLEQKGYILFYGAPFSSNTFIHTVESLSSQDGPLYRYDKSFKGVVTLKGFSIEIVYKYHVRPRGLNLEYDWQRLEEDLRRECLLSSLECSQGATRAILINSSQVAAYWHSRLKEDPFYLLNVETQKRVIPLISKLGRRLNIADFESEVM